MLDLFISSRIQLHTMSILIVRSSIWYMYQLVRYVAYRSLRSQDSGTQSALPLTLFSKMSSIPSLLEFQAMPSRAFRLRQLKEYTCPVCRITYEKRNSLNRHIRARHEKHLPCDVFLYQEIHCRSECPSELTYVESP